MAAMPPKKYADMSPNAIMIKELKKYRTLILFNFRYEDYIRI